MSPLRKLLFEFFLKIIMVVNLSDLCILSVSSLNDLAVDGTLNTTNQPTNFNYLNFVLKHKCPLSFKLTKRVSVIKFENVKFIISSYMNYFRPCRVGSFGSVSASRMVGREFASRPGHTKDHHKNGTNCLPAWHAMR